MTTHHEKVCTHGHGWNGVWATVHLRIGSWGWCAPCRKSVCQGEQGTPTPHCSPCPRIRPRDAQTPPTLDKSLKALLLKLQRAQESPS